MRSDTKGKDVMIWGTHHTAIKLKMDAPSSTRKTQTKSVSSTVIILPVWHSPRLPRKPESTLYHGTAKRMMENRHYLGDDFYPAIIDKEIFESAAAERIKRANKLGRLNHKRVIKPAVVPTYFHLAAAVQHYDDPRLQAEYLYSLH